MQFGHTTSAGWQIAGGKPDDQAADRCRTRREALAGLSEVHAQLSCKVQLLQDLIPRLTGQQAAGGPAPGDVLTAAAVAADAAALAAAGTRAAEGVGAVEASGVGASAGDSGSGGGLGGEAALQHQLVERMEAIRRQLSSVCSEMLTGALLGQGSLEGAGGESCEAGGIRASTGDVGLAALCVKAGMGPHAERSWGSQ
jgi:hypothetical protein